MCLFRAFLNAFIQGTVCAFGTHLCVDWIGASECVRTLEFGGDDTVSQRNLRERGRVIYGFSQFVLLRLSLVSELGSNDHLLLEED